MISKKKLCSTEEIEQIQYFANKSESDVSIHAEDNSVMIDAKSLLGFYTFDFSKPVLIVSEDAEFHRKIWDIGKNIL